MGCGEKTAVHLVVSTIEALMQPRVKRFIERLDGLIARLDAKAHTMLTGELDVEKAALGDGAVSLPVSAEQRPELVRIARSMQALKDLRWRYLEGPSGRGRAAVGITNSTGCSSVWASTYPYNPYPFPWVNHLFQDSPSVAIGIFEGHMRKMAENFTAVRRAELIATGEYDEARDEKRFQAFDWKKFSDDEFALAPPVMAVGGDGAMLDIGFQNLSRLMASGKPIRVLVLDTQVYSNTGGQACTSGFTGQIADMSAFGAVEHGKNEVRKELALIAIAHRGVFVHQTSQASATHLIAGVIRGLNSRRPAVFSIYTPCPVEHGTPDEWAPHGARLALESRAFPYLTYDPDAGSSMADCLSLEGNPAIDEEWPLYRLSYVVDGETREMELPLTIADWAATEARFRKHFREVPVDQWNEDMIVFHEYLRLSDDEREGKTPFVHAVDRETRLRRLSVTQEIVTLAEDRLLLWSQLRDMAGVTLPESARDALTQTLETEFDARIAALTADYERRIAELKETYPRVVARRMAETLIRGNEGRTIAEIVAEAGRMRVEPVGPDVLASVLPDGNGSSAGQKSTAGGGAGQGVAAVQDASAAAASASAGGVATAVASGAAAATAAADDDDDMAMEAYIETDRCTTCNECTNLNGKMFAYDDNKQAYIKDARAGTFAQLVQAAERCPAGLIHPGTPLNPKEKDLAKWIERAQPFT
jgi:pyruvate-ferredoxin/flavodoxin oxidoreductase